MLHLHRRSLVEDKAAWEQAGIALYQFDTEAVEAATKEAPQWIHFGGGNIFRAFIAALQQRLLDEGLAKTGIITAETYDEEVIEHVYRPFDNLSLAVTMYADGRFENEVIGSVVESVVCRPDFAEDWKRLKEIFEAPSLQVASFTITEKGYKLTDYAGNYFPAVAEDMKKGPEQATSSMGSIAALAYARYKAGAYPFAFLSLDNCSHNGDKIKEAMTAFAQQWVANGVAEPGFADYINDETKVSFPWSMIDKITPRSSEKVQEYLKGIGFGDTELIHTNKGYLRRLRQRRKRPVPGHRRQVPQRPPGPRQSRRHLYGPGNGRQGRTDEGLHLPQPAAHGPGRLRLPPRLHPHCRRNEGPSAQRPH